jgi:UDP-galactose transporter B1
MPPTAISRTSKSDIYGRTKVAEPVDTTPRTSTNNVLELLTYVSGIYMSFIVWAVLQERISTTPYGPDGRIFRASTVINTIQSALASLTGFVYLSMKRRGRDNTRYLSSVFPNIRRFQDLLIVAISQSVSSFFAYSSLKYVICRRKPFCATLTTAMLIT